jgi:hypothetical protein
MKRPYSYAINLVDVFRDIAAFVDQVARLGKAGDVPMRAPSHFHTAFNLETAKRFDSEHFRSAPRTCGPLRGRLSVR